MRNLFLQHNRIYEFAQLRFTRSSSANYILLFSFERKTNKFTKFHTEKLKKLQIDPVHQHVNYI